MKEPPEGLLERFDLVHLCLLSFVIKDEDLVSTLARVMKTVSEFTLSAICCKTHCND